MPGKYSHGLVLAQYSSQGIISLPNDNYFRSSPRSRPASAVPARQRNISNATKSSGHQSIAAQSSRSAGATPRSGAHGITPSRPATSQKRVVIVQSDSEHDTESERDESEEEWVRPQSKPSPRVMTATQLQKSAPPPSRSLRPPPRSSLRYPAVRPADKPNEDIRPLPPPKTPDPSTMARKRGGGVKALMQARHEAEMRQAEGSNEEADDGILLRDFLNSRQRPSTPPEKPLTVHQFLKHVPGPAVDLDEEATVEEPKKTAQTEPTTAPRSMPEPEPKAGRPGSAYNRQTLRNTNDGDRRIAGSDRRQEEMEPNFDGFSDSNEQAEFFASAPRTHTIPTNSAAHSTKAVSGRATGPAATKPTRVSHETATYPNAGSATSSTQRLKSSRRQETKMPKKRASHDRVDSSLSSVNTEVSSIFGKSSVGGTTQATSGNSTTSRSVNKLAPQHDWDLPRVRPSDDFAFTEIYRDFNTSTTFTSDEDESQDESKQNDQDLPNSRLQSIPESELFSTRQWGTISAGQNSSTRARDDDEISNMSACFPPDIGRYKYENEDDGPSSITLAGLMEEDAASSRNKNPGDKVKKSGKETGLLRKLRKKVTG